MFAGPELDGGAEGTGRAEEVGGSGEAGGGFGFASGIEEDGGVAGDGVEPEGEFDVCEAAIGRGFGGGGKEFALAVRRRGARDAAEFLEEREHLRGRDGVREKEPEVEPLEAAAFDTAGDRDLTGALGQSHGVAAEEVEGFPAGGRWQGFQGGAGEVEVDDTDTDRAVGVIDGEGESFFAGEVCKKVLMAGEVSQGGIAEASEAVDGGGFGGEVALGEEIEPFVEGVLVGVDLG